MEFFLYYRPEWDKPEGQGNNIKTEVGIVPRKEKRTGINSEIDSKSKIDFFDIFAKAFP